jgi:hypothetical protein
MNAQQIQLVVQLLQVQLEIVLVVEEHGKGGQECTQWLPVLLVYC